MIFIFIPLCENSQSTSIDILDILFKISAIIIAAINIFFAYWMFRQNKKDTTQNLKKDRGLGWLKTIILDQNLNILYDNFDNIEDELNTLKSNPSDDDKAEITSKTDDIFITIRRKFIDILLAIDEDLYEKILSKTDGLQEELYNNIYDQGINLSHGPKFNDSILNPISRTKTEIVKILYQFKD